MLRSLALTLTIGSVLALTACSDKGSEQREPITGPAGKLYVLNQDDTTITLFDTQAMTRLGSVNTVVAKPHYIVFEPDRSHYYVMTVDLSGRIAKFDAATDQFVSTFDLTAAARAVFSNQRSVIPAGMAITPDGQFGYMCDYTAGSERGHIYKIRLADLSVLKKIQSGAQTHELLATPDGNVIIACNLRSDDVTLLYTDEDTVTFVPIDPAQSPDPQNPKYGPYCIALDHAGNYAYITCLYAKQVRVLDIAARAIIDSFGVPVTPGVSTSGPAMTHISHDGKYLFATTKWGNSLVVLNLQSRTLAAEIPFAVGHSFGVALSADDRRVWVAASGTPPGKGYVYEIDVATLSKIDSVEVGTNSWGIGWVGEHSH